MHFEVYDVEKNLVKTKIFLIGQQIVYCLVFHFILTVDH